MQSSRTARHSLTARAPRHSLKTKLALFFGTLIFGLTAVIGVLVAEVAGRRADSDARHRLVQLAFHYQERLEDGLGERLNDVMNMAALLNSMAEDANADSPQARRLHRQWLERLQQSFSDYAWIGIADLSGRVTASTGGLLEGADVSARPWFQVAQQRTMLGDVHEALLLASLLPDDDYAPGKDKPAGDKPAGDKPAADKSAGGKPGGADAAPEPKRFVDIATPLYRGQTMSGVLGAHVKWSWAKRVANESLEAQPGDDSPELLIVDATGTVQLGPPGLVGRALGLDLAALTNGGLANFPDGQFLAATRGIARPMPLGWTALARQPADLALAPARQVRWGVIGGASLLAAVAFLLAWAVAERVARPLRVIATAAEHARSGAASLLLPERPAYAELASLSASLEAMVSDLARRRRELEGLNDALAQRVTDRTAALESATAVARRQEQLLQTVIDNLLQGVAAFDGNLRLIAWNDRFLDLVGLPPAFAGVGTPLESMLRWQAERGEFGRGDIEAQIAARLEEMRQRQPLALERTRPNGRVLEVFSRPTPDGGFVMTTTDATDYRRHEAQLLEQGERLRLMQDIAALANGARDLDRVLYETTRRLAEHFSWPVGHWHRREADGQFWPAQRWYLADGERYRPLVEVSTDLAFPPGIGLPGRAALSAEPVWISDMRIDPGSLRRQAMIDCGIAAAIGFPVLLGGRAFAVMQLYADSVQDPDPRKIALCRYAAVQLGRVAERLQAEASVREREATLQAIYDTVPDAILTLDPQGQIERVNAAAEPLFGRRSTVLIALSLDELLPGALPIEPGQQELEGVRPDGSRFPAELALAPFVQGERSLFVAVVRDITERRQVERMKNEFVSTVSHELRTPLTAIAGALSLIAGGVAGPLAPRAKQLVDIASKNSDRLVRLINDILDLEKIEAGKLEFRFGPIELLPFLRQVVDATRPLGLSAQIAVELDPDANDAPIQGDPDRLTQVVTNLISNAIKFSPPNSRVMVNAVRQESNLRVSVRDQGRGIPAAFRDRIFQRFAQADASDAREKGGTGLGLSIVQSIVLRHGGRVGFDSVNGQGATFWFELPLAEPAAGSSPPKASAVADGTSAVVDRETFVS